MAVAGLAGHAFESWESRISHQMWLKDFLPRDVDNIRVMTYGYNRSFSGDTTTKGRIDHHEHFTQELDNTRRSYQVNTSVSALVPRSRLSRHSQLI